MSGSWEHEPVLVEEVLAHMAIAPGMTVLDGTIGMAGHAVAILARLGGEGRLIGLDRDPAALATARERTAPYAAQVVLQQRSFAELAAVRDELSPAGLDAVLLDLGVSRDQLTSERFSFQGEAPLDLRLDPSQTETAGDLLARLSEEELAQLLEEYGDERFAARIARGVVAARRQKRLETSRELVEIIVKAYPPKARHGRTHIATRTFQALRIAVNDMYGALATALRDAPGCLRPGGRLGIISFHSGEDRQVKQAFKALAASGAYRLETRKPIFASDAERRRNPGARSARLRVLTAAAPAVEEA
ncbi:MAG: 16S rRNA (cytosine(1402)-N(4))-methyltransferase RsmH [Armatimonadetes bacterium]|nr:16S rRNA (cytosine(1402)-N(4))-methyltransferase RsmH [Armatimonadota bacterium]